MQELKFLVPFMGLLIAIPLVFGLAYLVWNLSPFAAAMVLLVGIVGLLLETLRVLNRAVLRDSQSG